MVRKKRKSKGNWSSETHEILGGKGYIFRVKQSGDVWQFRMWVPEEGKHLRKSLKTRDFDTAKSLAEEKVFQTFSDVSSGRKIFGVTLQELVDKFLEWREKDIAAGLITKGRLTTIKSQTNHILKFKSPDLKISELDRNSFFNWEQYRKTTTPGTQTVTIRNEQATINQMIDFGYREGYSHIPRFDFRPIKLTKDQVGRRDIFSLKEYDNLVRFMRTYTSKANCKDDMILKERLLVRDCVLIGSNTMMRVGELWQLQFGDIVGSQNVEDEKGRKITLVKINVRGETSKTRNSRTIITRGGNYIERIRDRSKYTSPTNYVFSQVDGTAPIPRQKWYLHWKILMEGIGVENYKERQLTWYSLRHFGITCRIRAKVPYGDIAEIAGTSSTYIENHYAHYDDEMKIDAAIKSYSIDKNGITFS